MIISRKSTFFLGIFIFIIPFSGFPSVWKQIFTVVGGLLVISSSLKIALPKKTSRKTPREKVTPVFVESMPVNPPPIRVAEVVPPPPPPPSPPKPEPKLEPKPEVIPEVVKPAKTTRPRKPRVTKKNNGPVI